MRSCLVAIAIYVGALAVGCGVESRTLDASPSIDAAIDAGVDATFDGSTDAGRDLGSDSGADLGNDASVDSGSVCFAGMPCDPVVGCGGGLTCQPPIGGIASTVVDVRDCTGGPGVDGGVAGVLDDVIYVDGYCTNDPLTSGATRSGAPGACDPRAASDDPTMAGRDGCPPCAKCVVLPFVKAAPTDPDIVQCLERCMPSATDAGGCRTGYECDVFSHTCWPFGCQTDLDCQHYLDDADADGVLDTGERLCRDGAIATCDPATRRCRHPARVGAIAGDPCTRDSECEADGHCLTAWPYSSQPFPGGYCTSYGCDIAGLECASTSDRCEDVGHGRFVCVHPCTVNAEDPSLVLGAGGHGDTCRSGYQCLYDGHSPVGTLNNGGCWLGNYDDVTTNDVGHACTADDECYSPHGAGRCTFATNRSCSILGCAGYPASADICGAGNECATFADGSSACLVSCTSAADCVAADAPSTDGCVSDSAVGATGTGRVCWPGCTRDSDCAPPNHCRGVTMSGALGQCMP